MSQPGQWRLVELPSQLRDQCVTWACALALAVMLVPQDVSWTSLDEGFREGRHEEGTESAQGGQKGGRWEAATLRCQKGSRQLEQYRPSNTVESNIGLLAGK